MPELIFLQILISSVPVLEAERGSNPEFTSSVIVAYARAAYRMNAEGQAGCKTVFDVAPAYLSPVSAEELRAKFL